MRFKKQFLLTLFVIGYSLHTFAIQPTTIVKEATYSADALQNGMVNHTVKLGETVYSIASTYKTTVTDIYKLNPGAEEGIKIGQVIRVQQATNSPTLITQSPVVIKHVIETKETLYSVSKLFNVTVDELKKANPGLNEDSFSIGKTIIIPQPELSLPDPLTSSFPDHEHNVEKQETLYSISKKYNTTVEEILRANPIIKEVGLKEGSTIYIPKNESRPKYAGAGQPLELTTYVPQDGIIRVGLLLPFVSGSKDLSQEKTYEYYEGFLLAVQRMKERGLNAEVFTFDIGTDTDTKRLESILGTNELHSLNLIIGGVSEKQVQLISRFSQRTGVKYVPVTTSRKTEIENNRYQFQVATSPSSHFEKIGRAFAARFNGSNIIFLSEQGSDNNKNSFVKSLQKSLSEAGIQYRTAQTTASITDDLGTVIDRSRDNVIIPSSSSEASLKRIMDAMSVLTKGGTKISLFGYPEWQTYINKTKKLHQYNSYFYTTFYLDNNNLETKVFADRYRKWFNKGLVMSYPKYAHFGYDTGVIFLTALQRLGDEFQGRISELNTATLQSAFYFEPISNKGGFVNTGVYFINLKSDDTVEKIDISKQ